MGWRARSRGCVREGVGRASARARLPSEVGLEECGDGVEPRHLDGRAVAQRDDGARLRGGDGGDELVDLRRHAHVVTVETLALKHVGQPGEDDGDVGGGGGGDGGGDELVVSLGERRVVAARVVERAGLAERGAHRRQRRRRAVSVDA
eukprot:92905-Pleurochrysis_carterae.AAC.2